MKDDLDHVSVESSCRSDVKMESVSNVEVSSSHESSPHASDASTQGGPSPGLADAESKRVWRSKLLVLFVLMLAATAVAWAAYYFTKRQEDKDFETQFMASARELLKNSRSKGKNVQDSYERFALWITGFALGTNASWPYLTIPSFEDQADHLRRQTQAEWVSFSPIVTEQDRESWQNYSVQHQGWINGSLALKGYKTGTIVNESQWPVEKISSIIYPASEPPVEPNTTYAPLWQISPVNHVASSVNYNTLAEPIVLSLYDALITHSNGTIFSSISDPSQNATAPESEWPNSFMAQPILDTIGGSVVGLLNSKVYWHIFFEDAVSYKYKGIVLVIRDTCHQPVTYQVIGGQVVFLGPGDMHDISFDYLQVEDANPIFHGIKGCSFSLSVYPTLEFHDQFFTFAPIINLIAVIVMFCITAVVFLVYDHVVEKRQKLVVAKAERSNAIVNSFFPTQVRDRLMEGQRAKDDNDDHKKDDGDDDDYLPSTALVQRTLGRAFGKEGSPRASHQSKAIADLYPHATVMFADIAGFTAWCSVREPSQVFTLLETVYNSFDKIAKQRRGTYLETANYSTVVVVLVATSVSCSVSPLTRHASRFSRCVLL